MIRQLRDDMPSSRFEVRVGHARVTVEAHTREEALTVGRRRLAEDMPRMWDRIYELADERFEVEKLN